MLQSFQLLNNNEQNVLQARNACIGENTKNINQGQTSQDIFRYHKIQKLDMVRL